MQCVILPDSFDRVLADIRHAEDKLFDFSNTDFAALRSAQITQLFIALSSLPQKFNLRLNNCRINEVDSNHLMALTLGLATTKNIDAFEFKKSVSLDCPKEVLMQIAISLTRNESITSLTIDGFRVTPPAVRDILRNHPTARAILVDGLLRSTEAIVVSAVGFFKPAANQAGPVDDQIIAQALPLKARKNV